MNMKRYEDIEIGDMAEVVHTITDEDIQSFGRLSGDYNPLHFDEEWAKKTIFGGRIAHGLLTASYISNAIGMKLPGTGAIYLSQEMKFWKPVRIGDTITTKVTVIEKNDGKRRINLSTECKNQSDETILTRNAVIQLMHLEL